MFWSQKKPDFKEPKKFIKTSVDVHDQTQIEAVFDYQILFGTRKKLVSRKLDYCLEAYFFLPQGFGLNEGAYPKESFYSDLRPLIRFREPRLGYKQIIGLKDPDKSPLKKLQALLERPEEELTEDDISVACNESRLFACIFISYFWRKMRKHLRKIEKASKNSKISSEERAKINKLACASCKHLMVRIEYILEEFHKITGAIDRRSNAIFEPLRAEMHRSDEYISYRQMDMLVFLLEKSGEANLFDDESLRHMSDEVQKFATVVRKRRVDSGYFLITGDSAQKDRESYMARRSLLKLHIVEILHLHMRNKPVFSFQRQFGAMVAAGLAALWAVVAQIIVISEVLNAGSLRDLWGAGGFLFLSAGVMAYIVKDRIKEAGRSYFRDGIWGSLPDNSERLTYGREEAGYKPQHIGNYRETATIQGESKLPSSVQNIRKEYVSDFVSPNTAHKVVCYRRDVSIKGQVVRVNGHALRIVHDILRFNISGFLGRLGDPTVETKYIDDKGELHGIKLPKVYHLDLVLRHKKVEKQKTDIKEGLEYLRLFVDKNGLKRIEHFNK